MRHIASENPKDDPGLGGRIYTLRDWIIGDNVRERLLVLQIAALALFLMACANVSSLLLARYSARRREFAIRCALGASRLRQLQQHVTESVALMACGAIAAVFVAWAGVRFLLWLYGDLIPRAAEISPDWRLVGLTTATAFGGAVAIGLTTALHENSKELEASLRESNRTTGSRRGVLTRRALVVLQVACAVALLGGAGELLQSVWTLLHLDVGINRNHLLTLHAEIPRAKYPSGSDIANFYEKGVARVQSLPGVERAAAINMLPVDEMGFNGDVEVQRLPAHSNKFFAEYRWVAGDYFQTMDIPLIWGRLFLPEEISGTKDPLGARLRAETPDWATVIAIARDVRQSGLAVPPRPEIYFPAKLYDTALSGWSLIVRSPLRPATLAPAVRRAIRNVGPDAVIYQIRTMDEVIAGSVSYERIVAALLLCFSVLALGLAALGIYGVVSFVVTERSPEFAIRAALGAGPGKVIQLVASQGLVLRAGGLVLGSAAVIPLNSVLANFLFGVMRLNALTLVSVFFVLALSGSAAVFFPSLRAAKVDPMRVLRQE